MKMRKGPLFKKVRPLGNLTDTYYTLTTIGTKTIDGVEFLPVYKMDPQINPVSKQTIYWMRKDNLEIVK